MNWECGNKSKLSPQEVAEQVLQIYTKSLQDQSSLKAILSELSFLDYFGKVCYGQEKVSSYLTSSLQGCNYELLSLSINDPPSFVDWDPTTDSHEKIEEDLGVDLISPPKLTFPSLTFTTPVRSIPQPRKRSASEASVENYNGSRKLLKRKENGEQSSSNKKNGVNAMLQCEPLSPENFQNMFPKDIRYLTAYGTIRYPRRVLPTMDPKRIKHHSLITLRDRFCQLYIGFECDEHVISVTNCKIWTIKYSVSSRVTPRNLLKSFNEVDQND